MNSSIMELIFRLKSACSTKEGMIQEKLRLSPAEFRGIMALSADTASTCNTVSMKMGLSISRGSRVIDKLVKDGYMDALKSPDDKRVLKVTLTKKGKKTRAEIYGILQECESRILKKLKKTEIIEIENSLNKISEALIKE